LVSTGPPFSLRAPFLPDEHAVRGHFEFDFDIGQQDVCSRMSGGIVTCPFVFSRM
jgi:hypothetical protein